MNEKGWFIVLIIVVASAALTIILALAFSYRDFAIPFNWDNNFITWILTALIVIATGSTGALVYLKFDEQKKHNYNVMYPKIAIKKLKSEKQEKDHKKPINRYNSKDDNLTFRVSFTNTSNNYGVMQGGVYSSIFTGNGFWTSKLKGTRGQKPLNMSDIIRIAPEEKLINDYTFPHHFCEINEQEQYNELLNALQNIKNANGEKDYDDINDHAFYYLIFLARCKIKTDKKWLFYTDKYYFFNFSNNTFSEIYHLPEQIRNHIDNEMKKHGWNIT